MINDKFFHLLDEVSPFFPPPEKVLSDYGGLVVKTPSEIVSLISSTPYFSAFKYDVHNSITGMEPKEVAKVLISVLDIHYHEILTRLNSDEAQFNLFRDVVYGLVEEVRR